MALIELLTEQFGYDEDGDAWRLVHMNPPRWEKVEDVQDEFEG